MRGSSAPWEQHNDERVTSTDAHGTPWTFDRVQAACLQEAYIVTYEWQVLV